MRTGDNFHIIIDNWGWVLCFQNLTRNVCLFLTVQGWEERFTKHWIVAHCSMPVMLEVSARQCALMILYCSHGCFSCMHRINPVMTKARVVVGIPSGIEITQDNKLFYWMLLEHKVGAYALTRVGDYLSSEGESSAFVWSCYPLHLPSSLNCSSLQTIHVPRGHCRVFIPELRYMPCPFHYLLADFLRISLCSHGICSDRLGYCYPSVVWCGCQRGPFHSCRCSYISKFRFKWWSYFLYIRFHIWFEIFCSPVQFQSWYFWFW